MVREFCKRMPVRCRTMKKKAYGNIYKYPVFDVTIPAEVARMLDLSTRDSVEFYCVETGDSVECEIVFIFDDVDEEEYSVEGDDEPRDIDESDDNLRKIIKWAYDNKKKKEQEGE